jgi:hypothetical protein
MSSRWSRCYVLALCMNVVLPSVGAAQGMPFALGSENVESENSLTPFKVKLRGILNATARGKSLGMVTLGVATYRAKYDFDVVTAEAVDDPRASGSMILRQYKDQKRDLNLAGPKELLSKIGQAEPGTPLMIVGFLRQRDKTLQLTAVEVLGASTGGQEEENRE